jgi:hypothetical protein
MNFELVYDAVTTSEAPRSAFGLSLALLVIVVAWTAWLTSRGKALHAGVKFLAFIVVVLMAVAIGSKVEQRYLASRTDFHIVQGPLSGHWTERVRRSGSQNSYWEWEGFRVQDVPFSYARNVEQNYFHNGGSHSIDFREGLVLRLKYIEERDGDKIRNHILRIEKATD